MKQKRGFTLIEILIAVTIIAILTAIGIVSYSSVNRRARDAKRKSDMEQIRSALEIYRNDYGVYPGTSTGFRALTSTEEQVIVDHLVPIYLPSVPVDPKSTTASPKYYWYDPEGFTGATSFYAYCLCGGVESQQDAGNQCPDTSATPPTEVTSDGRYLYCVYSP